MPTLETQPGPDSIARPGPGILHLVASVAPAWGGLAAQTLTLSAAQSELGRSSDIWCLDTFPLDLGAASVRERPAVRVFRSTPPARLGFSPWMERAAGSVEGRCYAVVHQHGLWRAFSRATLRWKAATGGPTVIAPGGTLSREALRYSPLRKRLALLAYERRNLRSAACLHAKSAAEADDLRRMGLSNPIAVVPGSIPDAWLQGAGDAGQLRRSLSIPAQHRIMLYLSRIHPIKGPTMLLEALASSRAELAGWILVIAGFGELGHDREVRHRSSELGLEAHVRFAGPLSGAAKRNAFAAADLFVLPTHSENFGTVVAEALGAGVPVVTTYAAPWHELEEHACGWHVETSAAAIAAALRDAARRPAAELRAMGRRGQQLVAERYTGSRIARQTLRLYDWLLGRGSRPEFVSDRGPAPC